MSKIRKRIAEHNAAVTPDNNIVQKSTFSFVPREKAEIVGSFGISTSYQPVFHDAPIDTVPVPPQPMRVSGSVQNDSTSHFKHYSTDISNDGTVNTLIINAVKQNGTTYRLKKIGEKVIEFSVNDKSIEESDFSKYQDEIRSVEMPYQIKRVNAERDKLKTQLLHESDEIKERLASLSKEQNIATNGTTSKKMKYIDGKWRMEGDTLGYDKIRLDYLKKQQELKEKLWEIENDEGYENRNKPGYFKTSKTDTLRFKSSILFKNEKFNTTSKLFIQSKLDIKRKAETAELQKKEDILKRELSQTQTKLLRLQNWML